MLSEMMDIKCQKSRVRVEANEQTLLVWAASLTSCVSGTGSCTVLWSRRTGERGKLLEPKLSVLRVGQCSVLYSLFIV